MKVFNCEERIAILVYKEISSNLFKNKIIYKLFIHSWYMYDHSTVCKQITDVKLNC